MAIKYCICVLHKTTYPQLQLKQRRTDDLGCLYEAQTTSSGVIREAAQLILDSNYLFQQDTPEQAHKLTQPITILT